MSGKYDQLKEKFLTLKGNKEQVEKDINGAEIKIEKLTSDCESSSEALVVIQKVAQLTQNNLKVHITSLVSSAILSVFDDSTIDEFVMEIETRRNQTEVDFYYKEFERYSDPLYGSGFGVVDVTAFGLGKAIWSLRKNRASFVEDEPFRNVSRDKSIKVAKMLRMLCDELKIQIIMVSHDTSISDYADTVHDIKKIGKYSVINTPKILTVKEEKPKKEFRRRRN